MIFKSLFKWKTAQKADDHADAWEILEKPIYDHEADHRETMQIIEDILTKLDEIKLLVDEMKNEDNKDV
jgi:hypothetical protein